MTSGREVGEGREGSVTVGVSTQLNSIQALNRFKFHPSHNLAVPNVRTLQNF